ncbi:hypothetical protein BpHYR1_014400 [Brachionus plicatilis]|uniref:Uncharacterized protein n=1 Tax=Brachionus plicatilis TaxID=10195 RepID=A0A3M7R1X3_BRAPC|nr:hypothetical protein BpHYR1_014400 [Brachionus plicatilis]
MAVDLLDHKIKKIMMVRYFEFTIFNVKYCNLKRNLMIYTFLSFFNSQTLYIGFLKFIDPHSKDLDLDSHLDKAAIS